MLARVSFCCLLSNSGMVHLEVGFQERGRGVTSEGGAFGMLARVSSCCLLSNSSMVHPEVGFQERGRGVTSP